jgi:hypothetical protein
MNEAEARRVLLVRACEDPPTAAWTAADRDAVSREAAATLGSTAAPARLIAARAALAAPRILAREPQAATALATLGWPAWAMPLAGLSAFGSGLAIDALGNARHINLFALPLLGLMAWNLLVYGLLLGAALRAPAQAADEPGSLARAIAWAQRRLHGSGRMSPVLRRFVAEWTALSAPLQRQRLTAVLHAAAALVALGVVAGLYTRGGFLEFRAGWESTFFDAATMHRFIGWLLGPAAWLSGIALPDVQAFAALRLSAGGGEIAARWIHLYAVTLGLVVVLPRAMLAGLAGLRARRLAQDLPIALDAPYFRGLMQGHGGAAQAVQVLPYSYEVPPEALAGVQSAVEAALGGAVELALRPTLPMGGEDDIDALLPEPADTASVETAAAMVLLFAATATPERETHGALVARLAERLRGRPARLLVVVDLSGLRRRFAGADGASRIAQRRAAWAALGRETGVAIAFAGDPATEAAA